MPQFNFRFQKILNLKENEKGVAQAKMANAIKQEEAGQQKSEAITAKILEAESLKKEKEQTGVNISELRMLEHYIYQLQQQSMSNRQELEYLKSNVSKTQVHLQNKAQEEKTWGSLKQQEAAKFHEQSKVQEQNFFDELASTRFYRLSQASISERG